MNQEFRRNRTAFLSDRFLGVIASSILPLVFFSYGLFCFVYVKSGLTIDGYFNLTSAQVFQEQWVYTGLAAVSWPPLYTILTSFVALFFELEVAARVVSLLSGTALVFLLPCFSRAAGYGYFPGILVQLLIVASPNFLIVSLTADNHVLDAMLFILVFTLGVDYLRKNMARFPYGLFVASVLLSHTKYSSWVLVVSLMVVMAIVSNRTSRQRQHGVIFVSFLVLSLIPWIVYNFAVNDVVVKGLRTILLMGQGLAENELIDVTRYEWWAYEVYDYRSALEFILTIPKEYAWHLLFNLGKLLEFSLFNFPVLGVFSFLVVLGLVNALVNLEDPGPQLLLTSTVLYSLPLILTRVYWQYFIHLILIWATVGMSVSFSLMKWQFSEWFQNRPVFRFALIIVVVPAIAMKTYADHRSLNTFVRRGSFPSGITDERLTENFRTLWNSTPNKNPGEIKVMGMFTYFPTLYRLGFQTVQAPKPSSSPEEFFCYNGLSEREQFYFKNLNYPFHKKNEYYVPADFVLFSPSLRSSIRRYAYYDFADLRPFLRPVAFWNYSRAPLYEVRKDAIDC